MFINLSALHHKTARSHCRNIFQRIFFKSDNISKFPRFYGANPVVHLHQSGIHFRCCQQRFSRTETAFNHQFKLIRLFPVIIQGRSNVCAKADFHPKLPHMLEIFLVFFQTLLCLCEHPRCKKTIFSAFTDAVSGNDCRNEIGSVFHQKLHAFLVNQHPVFNRGYACTNRIFDPVRAVRVYRRSMPVRSCNFDSRSHFFICKIYCSRRIPKGHHASRRGHFQNIRAIFEVRSGRAPCFVRAVNHTAQRLLFDMGRKVPVYMTAGTGKHKSGNKHPRSSYPFLIDGIPQRNIHIKYGSNIPKSCKACHEIRFGIFHRVNHDIARKRLKKRNRVQLAFHADMRVRVDQAGITN